MFNDNNNWQSTQNNWQGPYRCPTVANLSYGTHTNIVRVTSLEEAIMRTTQPGSDMMYIHQDKDVLYRVKVDFDGKKSWGEFPIVVPNQADTTPATKADINAVLARIEALEARNNVSEEVEDGKSV
jgi:hypothetical protein